MDKLYPPSIDGTIPAFYSEITQNEETGEEMVIATITIPFSMNRAVSLEDIKGFRLKIKTIQTNSQICVLYSNKDNIQDNKISFTMESQDLDKIHLGQFLKVQLAYESADKNTANQNEDNSFQEQRIGYYSTVGITKYTSKPIIQIQELSDVSLWDEKPILAKYTGYYDLQSNNNIDTSEKPYQQKFILYKINENNHKEIVEESDWFLYNLDSLDKNTYSFHTLLIDDTIKYIIKYNIITINGLEENISYCLQTPAQEIDPSLLIKLEIENNFEEGYNKIFFKENGWSFSRYATQINENLLNIENNADQGNIFSEISRNILTIANNDNPDVIPNFEINENNILLFKNIIFPQTDENIIIKIYRSDNTHNFKNWKEISLKNTNSDYLSIFNWSLKDFIIEQGETYQYAFVESIDNKQTNLIKSDPITVDFEDCFLYDGKQQLKIRFNPKISSFKTNRLEQKLETIGNRYPFIFRNNTVEYKEFPISGLISYHMDDNEEFMTKEDLNIVSNNKARRTFSPEIQFPENIETLNLIDYNIKTERLFKLKVLDWLGNGKIKLFKSPAEGNYLVRLMNISLSPEDKLSRMIHSFSCTAYEVQECNYENLSKLMN